MSQSRDTTKSKPVSSVQQSQLKGLKPLSKPKTFKFKSDNTSDDEVIQAKKPRYENYLKSGRKNAVSSQIKVRQLPPLKQLKKTTKPKASATITKAEFLKQNHPTESGFQNTSDIIGASTPITETNNTRELDELTNNATNVDTDQVQYSVQSLPTRNNKHVDVLENIMIKPATIAPSVEINHELDNNSNTTNLSSLIRDLFKQSEEKRIRFEARMQTQWELFVKKIMLTQPRNDGIDCTLDETDEFEDLDTYFPVTVLSNVEELDWEVQRDLAYKRRLRNRVDQLGGKNAEEAIRRKMKYLIADTVLERFSWKGTPTKRPFYQLIYLNDLIFQSVRTQFRTYTLKEYSSYMVQWVKHARTRQRTVVYTYRDNGGNRRNDDMANFEFKPTESRRNLHHNRYQLQAQFNGEAEISDFQHNQNGEHHSRNRRFEQRKEDMNNSEFKLPENRRSLYHNRNQPQAQQRYSEEEISDFQQIENGQHSSRNRRFEQRNDDMDNSEFKLTESRRSLYHNRYQPQEQRNGGAEISDFQQGENGQHPSCNRRFEQQNSEVDIIEKKRTGNPIESGLTIPNLLAIRNSLNVTTN